MSNNTKNLDLALLLLRIATGGLMLAHGLHKVIHGHDFIKSVLLEKGLPQLLWIGTPIAEVLAPILLILGVFGRISAALISVVMLFSIYLAFGSTAFTLTAYGGLQAELNIYFLIVSLALFLTGPGKYAVLKSKNYWLS